MLGLIKADLQRRLLLHRGAGVKLKNKRYNKYNRGK